MPAASACATAAARELFCVHCVCILWFVCFECNEIKEVEPGICILLAYITHTHTHTTQRRLIANSLVPKTKSWFANVLLWLPAAAWAKLPTALAFQTEREAAAASDAVAAGGAAATAADEEAPAPA